MSPRPRIVTLTLNPSVDVTFAVDHVRPGRKLRGHDLRHDPGGGGVNVARVLRRLGYPVLAVAPVGGPSGERLKALLRAEKAPVEAVPVHGETREDFTAIDDATGEEYRFVLPSARMKACEWAEVLNAATAAAEPGGILVASGSLPLGAPMGLYATLAATARSKGLRLALDASGPALKAALAEGVWLVKPNLDELRDLTGLALDDDASRIAACRALVLQGAAEWVALSMGSAGALLVSRGQAWRAAAPMITAVSTVGAGDSFLAGVVGALSEGGAPPEALRQGVAAGAASLLAPGTQLCRAADVEKLSRRICAQPVVEAAAQARPDTPQP
ncbi:MAG: 1-phosphofructokinase family hexose kinase [Proteobacteria bacterium]|nr:1-phosphofructokinase family hexose kinase [Pseudomonadota bacterium]